MSIMSGKQNIKLGSNRLKPPVKPQGNQTYLLIGKTGCGKSYFTKGLLENEFSHIPKDNRWLMSPTACDYMDDQLLEYFNEENIFNIFEIEWLEQVFLNLVKSEKQETNDKFYYRINKEGEKVKRKNRKNKKPKYQEYLLVVDDFIENLKSKGNKVDGLSKLIIKARHYNINMIMTSQYYKSVDPKIRSNTKNFIFWQAINPEIQKISEEHNIFENHKLFKKYFLYITDGEYNNLKVNNNYTTNKKFDDNTKDGQRCTPKDFKRMLKSNEIPEEEFV